jgi:hypothetical protein
MQDLIKDARLADRGGSSTLSHLDVKLVTACVDTDEVYAYAVFTSSSATLRNSFDLLRSPRCSIYKLADPDEAAVLERLQTRGYSKKEAEQLVGMLGTRLRLLDDPLKQGAAKVKADAHITERLEAGQDDLRALLGGVSPQDAAAVKAALNAMAVESDVVYYDLPPSVRRHKLFSKIFYRQPNGCVCFQSKLMQHAWARMKLDGGSK